MIELGGLDVETIANHEEWKQRNVLKFYRNKEEMLHGLNAVSEEFQCVNIEFYKNIVINTCFCYHFVGNEVLPWIILNR